MPRYTAVLFTNTDGTHSVRLPALPGCQAQGRTRGEALENAAKAATAYLAERSNAGGRPPREEWTPARTLWVQNPRRGDLIPYVAAVEQADGGYRVTPVLFPDIQETAPTIEEALGLVRPRILQHLTTLVAQGRNFPVQDDPHAYVITVPDPKS